MTLAVVGASHRTAPLEVRERLHVAPSGLGEALRRLSGSTGVHECVVLTTCNRAEVYLHTRDRDAAGAGAAFLADRAGLGEEAAWSHLYTHQGEEAARHLFRVAAGLDSLVLGEPQIQGQVAEAYRHAKEVGVEALGPVLHRLFQTALSAGGDVRARTAVSQGAASVPSAAVELATKVFGRLQGRRAMVIGAGEMGRVTLEVLLSQGVEEALVASRTVERAQEAARGTGARAAAYEECWGELGRADVVVTSTAAPHTVLGAERLREVRRGADRPLVVLDIAVPRDVEPEVGRLPGVFLYNVDDLQQVMERTEVEREGEMASAEALVEESVREFWSWYRAREAVPLIRAIREEAEAVWREEMDPVLESVEGLGPEERARIRRASRLVLKKVLHSPTVGLRELAVEEGPELLELVRRLFGLDETEAGPEDVARGDGRSPRGATAAPDGRGETRSRVEEER